MRAVLKTTSAIFFAFSCGSDVPPTIEETVALEAFSSCSELEDYLQISQQSSALTRSPYAYTQTNTQVPGVDEADLVETDGARIFVLSGNKLYAVQAWPPQAMTLTDDLELAGHPRHLLLAANGRLVVISEIYPNGSSSPITKATIVDTSESSELRVLRSYYLYGTYQNARRIGRVVYVVIGGQLSWPIPQPSIDCTTFYRPTLPVFLGLTTIGAIDLEGMSMRTTSVIGHTSAIHMTQSRLYLANTGVGSNSYVHKLDLREGVRYVASAVVAGYVPNQYAMDEHRGVLRIATTVEDGDFYGSRISTMVEEGKKLRILGAIAGIGQGSNIEGVRFLGPSAFISIEDRAALYAVDLSSPSFPSIAGKIMLGGAVSYLHPFAEDHLLAIGRSGRTLQLSILDVADLRRPRKVHSLMVGSRYGWTEAAFDPRAFTYFGRTKTLAIPYVDWDPMEPDNWKAFKSDLRLFKVDPVAGFRPLGAIDMSDLYRSYPDLGWSWMWSPFVRRGVMIDSYAYAISDAGVRAVYALDPSRPLSTVLFDGMARR